MSATRAERRPMALLDRDGVLNRDTGYPFRPDQIEWMGGVFAALGRLRQAGYRTVVVTNQSGIARGYFTEADVQALHGWMASEIAARGGRIEAFYYCPFHPEAKIAAYRGDHPDRKPNPGMLQKALSAFPTDLSRSFLIGDQPRDLAAAEGAGVRGYRFDGGSIDVFVARVLADQ